ncbi:hypothetical protein LTR85_003847 [Meristemomyces frigidus]|nr:hypothetical protein LTR85_003847 [Meristemomyces frigidus]
MSYNPSMSPPQKPAPRPYSPAAYQNAGSPTNAQGFAQPPAKRQRLSPDPRSPAQQQQNGLPQYGGQPQAMGTPGGYGNPYAPQQSPYGSPSTFAGSPQSSFNTPQIHQQNQQQWFSQPPTPATGGRQMSPPGTQSQTQQMQSSQMMPPPPRPNKDDKDDRMSVDDINDPMYGSGINLKDEENYMHSFQTNQSTSFGSSTMSPNNSFSQLRQSFNPDSQRGPGGAFAGTMGDVQSQDNIEDEVRRKRERAAAARERAEKKQHPMEKDAQFLQTNSLRRRIDERCRENGVNMDVRGLYQRLPHPEPQPPLHPYRTNVMMNGVANEGIVAVDSRPEYTAGRGEPFEQVLSLLCLAAGDRLRGLMDEAFALSRARRFGDHGRVPPEFPDIAVGQGERSHEVVRPENVTGSQWDRVPEAASSPAAANGDLPNGTAETATPQPLPTISFSNAITARLREVALRDKAAEDERIKKREARRKRAAEAATPTDDALDTPAPEEAATAPKISKKEQERQKKEASKLAEKNLHSTTNQTAALMALSGKNKKRYSWMTGGVAAMPTNRFAPKVPPAGSGTATPTANADGAGAVGDGGAVKQEVDAAAVGSPGGGQAAGGQAMARGLSQQEAVKVPEWGDWREDSLAGRGIQARDWVIVLERDGRERRALQRVLNRLA